jgi:hypothetical protein
MSIIQQVPQIPDDLLMMIANKATINTNIVLFEMLLIVDDKMFIIPELTLRLIERLKNAWYDHLFYDIISNGYIHVFKQLLLSNSEVTNYKNMNSIFNCVIQMRCNNYMQILEILEKYGYGSTCQNQSMRLALNNQDIPTLDFLHKHNYTHTQAFEVVRWNKPVSYGWLLKNNYSSIHDRENVSYLNTHYNTNSAKSLSCNLYAASQLINGNDTSLT